MNRHFTRFLTLSAALASVSAAWAIPAKRGVLEVPLRDGTTLSVTLGGDERFHQYFTEDGFPLIEKDGLFYYCDITPGGDLVESGLRAMPLASRGAAEKAFLAGIDKTGLESRVSARARKAFAAQPAVAPRRLPSREQDDTPDGPPYEKGYGLFPAERGNAFPAYGDQKGLVVIVEYADVKFTLDDPYDYFNRMLNEEGFSDYGATGCAAEYFRLNSSGAFRPQFDVYGPVTLPRNRDYYGGNNMFNNDSNPQMMVVHALDILDPEVDFSQYDRDGDGYIDNVFVFYAGGGEATGAGANTVWPHSWDLSSGGAAGHVYDGVEAEHYACTNEWVHDRPDGVGTFIHEFSHVMGLPDLYATSYTGAFTPGAWSAMDYGPYNNDGMTPPLYSAFERYALGWMEPREISCALSATLEPIGSNAAGIIRTEKDTEFFLIENRQQTGWDAFIPGHGMLVWHVDYDSYVWASNTVNNTPGRQYVDIEEADGTATEGSRAGDAFPGTSKATSFTSETRPAMTTWDGVAIDLPVTDITETADGIITFNVLGGTEGEVPDMEAPEILEVNADYFVISWPTVGAFSHSVWVYTRDADGAPVYVEGYHNRLVSDEISHKVTGLKPKTTYYYVVSVSDGWHSGAPCEEGSVVTIDYNLSYYDVEATPATDIYGDCFTANWSALDGASGYLVSVRRCDPVAPYLDFCDFADGVKLPGGWRTSATRTYTTQENSGENPPSLRVAKDGDFIGSPGYQQYVSHISFWHRGNATTGKESIVVESLTGDTPEEIYRVPVVGDAGGAVTEFDVPEGVLAFRLRFEKNGGRGAVAIDDIKVTYGMQYDYTMLPEYESLNVGDVCSRRIDGLLPETEYAYMVQATDGAFFSGESQWIGVKTTTGSGVSTVDANRQALVFSGMTARVDGDYTIDVIDVAGVRVCSGRGSVVFPSAGLYIVSVPELGITLRYIAR